jgi:hypothetical protein
VLKVTENVGDNDEENADTSRVTLVECLLPASGFQCGPQASSVCIGWELVRNASA